MRKISIIAFAVVAVCAVSAVPLSDRRLDSSSSSKSRQTHLFDYGWRFQLDDAPNEAPTCTFSRSLTNLTCDTTGARGLKYTPDGRVWPKDCERACATRSDCTSFASVVGDWGTDCYISFSPDSALSCNTDKEWAQQNEQPRKVSKVVYGGAQRSCVSPAFSYALPTFNDKSWTLVNLPHDSVANSTYSASEDNNHGSFVRRVAWYRKSFSIPPEWKGSSIFIEFEAVFHLANIFVNGKQVGEYHSGYVPIRIRIDDLVNYGAENVIAVRADPTFGSGHWYEGGGIYRNTWLVRTNPVHVLFDGVYNSPDRLSFAPSAVVANDDTNNDVNVIAVFTLQKAQRWAPINDNEESPADGAAILIQSKSDPVVIPRGSRLTLATAAATLPSTVLLWSVDKPTMYSLTVDVYLTDGNNATALDTVSVYTSYRSSAWKADTGFSLNNQHVHLHGFCHHEDFTGVGVAINDRINLFRAQALRSVGGNSWRMSHNPYRSSTYDLLDRLGVVVWDEARDFAEWYVDDMTTMVLRDRNHPSVIVWSFCNEIECHQDLVDNVTAIKFRDAAKAVDTFRPVSFNWVQESSDIVDASVDIHGISHYDDSAYFTYHKAEPSRPLVSSECCSCETQRGEWLADKNASIFYPGFDGECLKQQVPWTETENFVAGTMGIWTLFDYYGEPGGWPHISSSFGQFDLAGVPKAHAYWYQAWWGCTPSAAAAPSCYVTHIAEEWDRAHGYPPLIHVISNAHTVELTTDDGLSLGNQTIDRWGYGQYDLTAFMAAKKLSVLGGFGGLTATARDETGKVVGTHTVRPSSGKAVGVELIIDAPNVITGTGTTLLLDGHDTALIRARVVDEDGLPVHSATDRVRFRVTQGPGRVIAVGNGDPSSHEPNQVDSRAAYHGMVRAIVQVTADCVSSQKDLSAIDVEGGSLTTLCDSTADLGDIVVEAYLEDVASPHTSVAVPTSPSRNHDPLNVAAGKPSAARFLEHFH